MTQEWVVLAYLNVKPTGGGAACAMESFTFSDKELALDAARKISSKIGSPGAVVFQLS